MYIKACHFLQHMQCSAFVRFHGSGDLYAETLVRHLKVRPVFVDKVGIFFSEHSLECDLCVSFKKAGVEFSHGLRL